MKIALKNSSDRPQIESSLFFQLFFSRSFLFSFQSFLGGAAIIRSFESSVIHPLIPVLESLLLNTDDGMKEKRKESTVVISNK